MKSLLIAFLICCCCCNVASATGGKSRSVQKQRSSSSTYNYNVQPQNLVAVPVYGALGVSDQYNQNVQARNIVKQETYYLQAAPQQAVMGYAAPQTVLLQQDNVAYDVQPVNQVQSVKQKSRSKRAGLFSRRSSQKSRSSSVQKINGSY